MFNMLFREGTAEEINIPLALGYSNVKSNPVYTSLVYIHHTI